MEKVDKKKQAERHIQYGYAELTQGRYGEAMEEYRKAIKVDKNCFEAYKKMGDLYLHLKRLGLAGKAYEKAVEINPNYHMGVNALGSVYLRQGKNSKAAQMFQRAIEIDPKQKNAFNNLGIVLEAMKYYEGSVSAYKKAIELDPEYAGAYYNLGYVYKIMDKMDKSVDAHFRAVEISPDFAEPISLLYLEMALRCDWKRTETMSKRMDILTNKTFQGVGRMMEQAYVSIFRSLDEKRSLKVAKHWAKVYGSWVEDTKPDFIFKKNDKKKLTIGYLSYDLRNHPVGQQIADLFTVHDKRSFKIIAYSYGPEDGGIVRQRIKKGASVWVDCEEMSHLDLANKIYEDGVDILIDLNGYTNGCRVEVSAMRPAPITVNWLGYPGTTGADYMDYMIVDRTIAPKGSEDSFSEKLVYMPDCYSVTSKPVIAKEKSTRADHNLPKDAVVLVSFNSPTKIVPLIFDAWMNILKATNNSVLWLWKRHEDVEKNLSREAKKRGVDPKRIVFAESMPSIHHLERIRHADLALDTQIVSGGATTSQAMWLGVPVVTVEGSHYLSRMSASMVKAAGLPELVLKDLKEYEKKIIDLVENREKIVKLKKKLKKNLKTAPLFDTKLFATNLEKEYRKMWDEYIKT